MANEHDPIRALELSLHNIVFFARQGQPVKDAQWGDVAQAIANVTAPILDQFRAENYPDYDWKQFLALIANLAQGALDQIHAAGPYCSLPSKNSNDIARTSDLR